MIELDVSSANCCSLFTLMAALQKAGVHAQVTETMSTVGFRPTPEAEEQTRVEAGFHLLIHNVDAADFRVRVWMPLERLMPIVCAHVRDGDRYLGCVSNWPGVMVQTRCTSVEQDQTHPDQPKAAKPEATHTEPIDI